jgi:phage baseplate assembly protein W
MYGFSPKLPLMTDKKDGAYMLNKTLVASIKQNFKVLVMTSPGERVMDINFGVGIRRYLFENFTPALEGSIRARINKQVKKYMPFVTIREVDISQSPSNENRLNIKIKYFVEAISHTDELALNLANN